MRIWMYFVWNERINSVDDIESACCNNGHLQLNVDLLDDECDE